MAFLAKKYALIDESTLRQMKTGHIQKRNPFTNVQVATTKDIGQSISSVLSDDQLEASTKQLMFNSLLDNYRERFRRATSKKKKPSNMRTNQPMISRQRQNPQQVQLQPNPQIEGVNENEVSQEAQGGEENETPHQLERLLPQSDEEEDNNRLAGILTPPITPSSRKTDILTSHKQKTPQKLADSSLINLYGGPIPLEHAPHMRKVLNKMHALGLITRGGRFIAVDTDRRKIKPTEIKSAIKESVLPSKRQSGASRKILNILKERGVPI